MSAAPAVPEVRGAGFPIRPALYLAPMEGVTDAAFRALVIDLGGVAGACTDFVRVAGAPYSPPPLRRRLGPPQSCPVGLQVMAGEADEFLQVTVANAEQVGAAFIDCNFGCPAPKVVNNCAGSALLDHPDRLAAIVRACCAATGLPVTAKLRVGTDSDQRLEEIVLAAAESGAAAIAMHARRRIDPYSKPAHWPWLQRSVDCLRSAGHTIPVIGNGSVRTAGDAQRLRDETGCDAVMIGLGALADPFVFRQCHGQKPASSSEAADFACRYFDTMSAEGGARQALGRFKQMIRNYTAGDLFADTPDDRQRLLRERDPHIVRAWFAARLASLPVPKGTRT